MRIYCIFVQRACRYEGEYAPELFDACDWQTMEENGEWFESKLQEANKGLSSGEFTKVITTEVEIDGKAFDALFAGPDPLKASIKAVPHE